MLVIFALNLYSISFGEVHLFYERNSLVRSQFYFGLIAMAALAGVALEAHTRADGGSFVGLRPGISCRAI